MMLQAIGMVLFEHRTLSKLPVQHRRGWLSYGARARSPTSGMKSDVLVRPYRSVTGKRMIVISHPRPIPC